MDESENKSTDQQFHSSLPNNAVVPGIGSILGNSYLKRCKIVGTLGPASHSPDMIEKLIKSGVNVIRLNFSHGSHDDHLKNIHNIREISNRNGFNVAILQDLQGPKIRCGKLLDDKLTIQAGHTFRLQYGHQQEEPQVIPIDYANLIQDINIGQKVMMDDGLLIFEVKEISKEFITVECISGGILKSRKGVNFPGAQLSIPAMTDKDTQDLLFGISHGIEYVGLSFVQRPEDIKHCKEMIAAMGAATPVIAKIEMHSAIINLEEITDIADGLMVARGDLGVECTVEKVPYYQKMILNAGKKYNKPVIIATQMLESMVEFPRASLSEISDVAGGVLEGADALMLSAEMASGKYPLESVKTMNTIISEVENSYFESYDFQSGEEINELENYLSKGDSYLEAHNTIALSAIEAAHNLKCSAIVCLTLTGSIAKIISRLRPRVPIIAISPRLRVVKKLSLTWGVYGIQNQLFYNTDKLLHELPNLLKSMGVVATGDVIIITAGVPINSMKSTNMLKINTIP